MISYSDTIRGRRRLGLITIGLVVFGLVLSLRLVYLQVVQHEHYLSQASSEHTRKYLIPARRGEIYVHDGDSVSPIALNQTMKIMYADPRFVGNKADMARKLAAVTGGDAADYQRRLEKGIEYAVLADRLPNDVASRVKDLNLIGIGLADRDYRIYPEGSLLSQVVGFVNGDGDGQYGVEQYLGDRLAGTPGQLAAKTDTHGIPIATANNVVKPPADGASFVLTIDRNVQAMVERELADRVQQVHAKSASAIVLDPNTGAVRAMASYPSYDPNQYTKVTDYDLFLNKVVSSQFEPGSGAKAFTMAAGLDQGKITPDSTYDDPGCVQVSDRNICNAAGDKPGKNKTMTVVLRDSLNTGVMFVLRLLGGDNNKITLAGKKILSDYFTKHFGFGARTGIEQPYEAKGSLNPANNAAGNDVNYANMSFGQGMSVTMMQMAAAMAAVANGGKLYQPHLIDGVLKPDGTIANQVQPKLVRDAVISPQAAKQLTGMLTVVVEHGSGYKAKIPHYEGQIAGKTGTAQIPRPDGQGYIEGANIGSFTGFAPVRDPKFVIMVRIDEPKIDGYAETTTVPLFRSITDWLFKYYAIPPNP